MQILSSARLLSLTGPGGAGKTRLSLQVAAEVFDTFKNGTWFIELASLSDPVLVPFTIGSTLGLREEPGLALITTLMDWLKDKELLIILDNCEHLIEACAHFADEILHASRLTRILATSREALGIPGESIYRVPPLPTPNPQESIEIKQIEKYAAVRLFIDRAMQSLSTFQVTNANAPAIAQICYRLDGIPLAIELAAVRVKTLSVEKITERLDNRFLLLKGGLRTAVPRQQTLRSMIDWSHSLLSESEQILFQRLSVFAGGWTLEAAEEICSGNGLELVGILDLSTHLLEKSLAVMDEGAEVLRFHMLETIREYAVEKLKASGEEDVIRLRHAAYFSNLVEETELNHLIPDYAGALNRLEKERENVRAALHWSQIHDREGTFLLLAGHLWRFWVMRGPVAEGRNWLDQATAVCETAAGRVEYGLIVRVLAGGSELARIQGDFDTSIRLKQRVLEISQQSGDETWAAAILSDLAIMYAHHGNCRRSLTMAGEALALRRKLGKPLGISHALGGLFFALMCLDEPQKAREAVEEALQIDRLEQSREGVAWDLLSLTFIAARQEQYEEAERILEEFVPLARDIADQNTTATGFYVLATLAAAKNQAHRAARLLGYAEQMASLGGFQFEIPGRTWVEKTIKVAKAHIGEAVWTEEYQAGQTLAADSGLTTEKAIAFALESGDE
jgi:non-specific serine/threonine protein kinase